jgi:hypothetical protein
MVRRLYFMWRLICKCVGYDEYIEKHEDNDIYQEEIEGH